MSADTGLVERLEAWGPLVSSGYEVPAAGQTMFEAASRIRELEAALAAETERCAKVAETYDFMWTHQQVIGDKIAAAIRAGALR